MEGLRVGDRTQLRGGHRVAQQARDARQRLQMIGAGRFGGQ